jgi:hypothetical protein
MPGAANDLTQIALGTTLLILLLAGFILSILFLYRKKQIAYQKELEYIKSESEKTMLNTQLEIQEQTFQNISREIHDHICLNLTLAKLNLVTLEPANKQQLTERINSSIELLSNSISELSDISHSMNPELIESFGLIKTLEMEIEKIERPGLINIKYHVMGNPVFMTSQKELVTFRIIQEAFNNIIKHAKAKNVLIRLFYSEDQIEVTIQDDGIGFNPENFSANGSCKAKSGLINMKKRANLIEGHFEITSKVTSGTHIHLSIPY